MNTPELDRFLRNMKVDRGLAAAYAADPEAVLAETTLGEADKARLRALGPQLQPATEHFDAAPGF